MFGPELWIAFTWYHVLHLCRFPGSLARRAQSSKSCVRRDDSGHGGHGGYGFSTASRCSALNQGNCGSLQMTLTLSFEYLPYLPQNKLGLVFIPLFFLFCCRYSLGATSLDRFVDHFLGIATNQPRGEWSHGQYLGQATPGGESIGLVPNHTMTFPRKKWINGGFRAYMFVCCLL